MLNTLLDIFDRSVISRQKNNCIYSICNVYICILHLIHGGKIKWIKALKWIFRGSISNNML